MNYSAIDPEIAAYLEQLQSTMETAHHLTAKELRETFDSFRMQPGELIKLHEVRDLSIASSTGDINARLYKPVNQRNLPLLVWFHGGGWVAGDLERADMTCRDIASKSGCIVLSVDYALAPEHVFPAAFDDAVSALRYAFDNADFLGASASHIAVGGDSAGANLATCACIAARDLDVKCQLLIYPVVEADFNNDSYTANANHYFLTRDLMMWFWNQYVPDNSDRSDTRVAPLNARLGGLPPAYLLTVKFDPLCDEGKKYARALQDAGVVVSTAHSIDTVHGFFTTPTQSGARARSEAATWLASAML